VENVKTQAGARTMALDEQTHNVYLAIAEYEAAAPAPPAGANGKAARVHAERWFREALAYWCSANK